MLDLNQPFHPCHLGYTEVYPLYWTCEQGAYTFKAKYTHDLWYLYCDNTKFGDVDATLLDFFKHAERVAKENAYKERWEQEFIAFVNAAYRQIKLDNLLDLSE